MIKYGIKFKYKDKVKYFEKEIVFKCSIFLAMTNSNTASRHWTIVIG
jgi:hypothetical protein